MEEAGLCGIWTQSTLVSNLGSRTILDPRGGSKLDWKEEEKKGD